MSFQDTSRSISALLGDALLQLGGLVQNEVRLARAELSQKVSQAGTGIAFLGAAAVVMIPALVMLLIGFALWLAQNGFSPAASHLTAAAAGAVVSVVLAMIGMNCLKSEKLAPKVTMKELGRDVASVKEMMK